jgi:hypothetical protein
MQAQLSRSQKQRTLKQSPAVALVAAMSHASNDFTKIKYNLNDQLKLRRGKIEK